MRRGFSFTVSFLILCLLVRCEQSDDYWTKNPHDNPGTFFSTMRTLSLEVAHEPFAEPFTGKGVNGGNLWDFTDANLKAAFQGRSPAVIIDVPKELGIMQRIPSQGRRTYSTREIALLAERYRRKSSTLENGYLFALFLDGFYEEGGAENRRVLGVHLQGTSVVAIFKRAQLEAGRGRNSEWLPKYVEQTTLIHEIGHALGLVNNGVPMLTPHQDVAFGAHCTNPECVMYHENEAAHDLERFVLKLILSGDLVVMGPECLMDLRSYKPR